MPGHTKIVVNVPEPLLTEISSLEAETHLDHSELVLEALQYYLGERKRKLFVEQMKRGYLEMAEINLSVCEECWPWEYETLIYI